MGKEGNSLLDRLLAEHDAKLQKIQDYKNKEEQSIKDEAKRKASELMNRYITAHQNYETLIVPLEIKYKSEADTSNLGQLFDDFKSQIYKRQKRDFTRGYTSLDWGIEIEESESGESFEDRQWCLIRWWESILQMYHNNNDIHPKSIRVVYSSDNETRKNLLKRKINYGNDTEVTYKFERTEFRFGWEKTEDNYKYFIGNNIHGNCNGTEEQLGKLVEVMASILKNERFDENVFFTKKYSGVQTEEYSNYDEHKFSDLGGTS